MVGVQHNIRSFDSVLQFIESSETLQEIDLSRSIVIKGSWLKLANVLGTNRSLTNVQLGYNALLEDQSWRLTPEQKAEGLTEAPLSAKN